MSADLIEQLKTRQRTAGALRRPWGVAPRKTGDALLASDCLFVSDVHLFKPEDANTRLLIDLIGRLASDDGELGAVRHLFLVGDIFEFIDASSSYFRMMWCSLFEALAELRDRGANVYFIEGNHDFGFGAEIGQRIDGARAGWSQGWATFAGDAGLDFEHPALGPLHVRHGDDVVTEHGYLLFRAFVKSRIAGRILRLVPSAPAHHFFLGLARLSRRAGSGYDLALDKIHRDVKRFLACHPELRLGTLIIGHIHVYLDTCVGDTRVLSGPDWHTAPSYLLLTKEGLFSRKFLDPARTVPVLREQPDP